MYNENSCWIVVTAIQRFYRKYILSYEKTVNPNAKIKIRDKHNMFLNQITILKKVILAVLYNYYIFIQYSYTLCK